MSEQEQESPVADGAETTARFVAARDLLVECRADLRRAHEQFRWPRFEYFNWGLDYFDAVGARGDAVALLVTDDQGHEQQLTYRELAERSTRVAGWLQHAGVRRGDAVLVMLGNVPALWEVVLAAIKLGAVIVPASTLLRRADLADRMERGAVKAVVTDSEHVAEFAGIGGAALRIVAGAAVPGWMSFSDAGSWAGGFEAGRPTRAKDRLLLYFTSGTTSRPKLVEHTHESYPIGHLSTMYWIGLKPGDVHLNLSSPGWAKHAWSSVFAPWNAEATVVAYNYRRFDARALLDILVKHGVTTFCAPPTVWRLLVQEDLRRWPVVLREAVSAGEPLNPEVIYQVREAWSITIRDGFGQTETTALIGNSPGQLVRPGAMGRALPGYSIVLLDPDGSVGREGEICVELSSQPLGVTRGYEGDPQRTQAATRGGLYRTGDIAVQDEQGYLTFVGRTDDVFKSSDYRISPFELESVLVEHPAVVEAAVIPMPDPVRLAVPKAFVVLAAGWSPCADTARSILTHVAAKVAPFKRVRCIEFCELPKTVSGKIRRNELRLREATRSEEEAANVFHEARFAG